MIESKTKEALLYDALRVEGYNVDVLISDLYMRLRFNRMIDVNDTRLTQQYVGSVISKLNAILTNEQVVPGRVKRTYRLTKKK